MTLEEELAQLRAKVDELDERLRVRRVAETFPESPILAGDHYVSGSGNVGTCIREATDNLRGQWTEGRNGMWEGTPPYEPKRLYTRAEVYAIVGQALKATSP